LYQAAAVENIPVRQIILHRKSKQGKQYTYEGTLQTEKTIAEDNRSQKKDFSHERKNKKQSMTVAIRKTMQ